MTLSWQLYIDKLLPTRKIANCAIYCLDGELKARTPSFSVSDIISRSKNFN